MSYVVFAQSRHGEMPVGYGDTAAAAERNAASRDAAAAENAVVAQVDEVTYKLAVSCLRLSDNQRIWWRLLEMDPDHLPVGYGA